MLKTITIFFGITALALSSNAVAQWQLTSLSRGVNAECLIIFDGNIYAGTDSGVFISSNSGLTWDQRIIGLQDSEVTTFSSNGQALFAGTWDSGMFISTNGANEWKAINSSFPVSSHIAASIFFGNTLYAGTSGSGFPESPFEGILKSTNNGDTWSRSGLTNLTISSFASIGSYLFVGTDAGFYLSIDSGSSWNLRDSNFTYFGYSISSIAVIGSKIFTSSFATDASGAFYFSSDSGTSWNQPDSGLNVGSIYVIYPLDGNLFIGTDSGGFLSTDEGASWGKIDSGIDYPSGYKGIFDYKAYNGYLFAIADSGLWRISLSDFGISSVASQNNILSSITAFPNPANTETVISFGISKEAYVKLELYDVLGHPVSGDSRAGGADLREMLMEPGNKSVPISLAGLPSGTYYARIQTAYGEVESVKIVKE